MVADRERARRILEAQEPGVGGEWSLKRTSVTSTVPPAGTVRTLRGASQFSSGIPSYARPGRARPSRMAIASSRAAAAAAPSRRSRARRARSPGPPAGHADSTAAPARRPGRRPAWQPARGDGRRRWRRRRSGRGRELRPGRRVRHRDARSVGERRASGAPGGGDGECREGGDRRRHPRPGHRRTGRSACRCSVALVILGGHLEDVAPGAQPADRLAAQRHVHRATALADGTELGREGAPGARRSGDEDARPDAPCAGRRDHGELDARRADLGDPDLRADAAESRCQQRRLGRGGGDDPGLHGPGEGGRRRSARSP